MHSRNFPFLLLAAEFRAQFATMNRDALNSIARVWKREIEKEIKIREKQIQKPHEIEKMRKRNDSRNRY